MKKFIVFLILSTLAFSPVAFAEREVMIQTAQGEVVAMEKKVPERIYKGEGWLLLDDFEDKDLKNNMGGESGAWNLDPVDEDNANSEIKVVKVKGPDGKKTRVLKINYDVDSTVQAQNGFWTKLRGLDASIYDTVEFDVRGSKKAGSTSIFKIEIKKYKDKDRTELIRGSQAITNVSPKWQHVELKLNKFTGIMDFGDPAVWQNPSLGRKDLEEFVVVFKDRQVDKKVGAVYIDNIKFTQKNDPGPTAVDAPARHALKTPPTHFKTAGTGAVYAGKGVFAPVASLKQGDPVMLLGSGRIGREVVFEEKKLEAAPQFFQVTVGGTKNFSAGNVIWENNGLIAAGTPLRLADGTEKTVETLRISDVLKGVDVATDAPVDNTVLAVAEAPLPAEAVLREIGVRLEGFEFQQFLASRLKGYPKQTVVKKEFPADDREFLRAIAKDTWEFFNNIVDKETHLPLDTVQFAVEAPIHEKDAWVGDYTNITNIGMYFLALVGAKELGFITREDAMQRALDTIRSVKKLPKHESGFYFNYYDTSTLEQTSYFVSSVDSGWLAAGLIVVRNAFPEIAAEANEILDTQDFGFFYDKIDRQLSHGFYQHLKIYSDYNYGAFYTEPRMTSFIGIGKGDIPVEHWFGTYRTFPEEYSWQQSEPINRVEKEVLGTKYPGGFYKWRDHLYVPSWGGSLFEALMPTLVMDEKGLSPDSLGKNNYVHAKMHAEYALDELKYPVWGMSPSSVPEGGYSEYGVAILGSKGYKPGVVTPHVTGLAVNFIPQEAISNFRKLIELYDIYGEYGFYDAVTVETGLVAYKYLALDQGMLFGGLVNYLTDGSLIKYFMQDPIAEKAKPVLTEEKLFEPPYVEPKKKTPQTA